MMSSIAESSSSSSPSSPCASRDRVWLSDDLLGSILVFIGSIETMSEIRRVNKSFHKSSSSSRVLNSLSESFSMRSVPNAKQPRGAHSLFPSRLRHLTDVSADDGMPDISTLKHLESIELTSSFFVDFAKFPPSLKSIEFTQLADPDNAHLQLHNYVVNNIIKRCPSIESIVYSTSEVDSVIDARAVGFQPADFALVSDTLTTLKLKHVAMNWECLPAMDKALRALRRLILNLRVLANEDEDKHDNDKLHEAKDIRLPSSVTELTLKNIMLSPESVQDEGREHFDSTDTTAFRCATLPPKIRQLDFFRLTHLSIHHGMWSQVSIFPTIDRNKRLSKQTAVHSLHWARIL